MIGCVAAVAEVDGPFIAGTILPALASEPQLDCLQRRLCGCFSWRTGHAHASECCASALQSAGGDDYAVLVLCPVPHTCILICGAMCTCAGADAATIPMQIMRTHFVLESGMPAQRVEPMDGDKEYLQVRTHSQAAGQLLEKADGSFTVAAGMTLLILTIICHSTCQPKPQMPCLFELVWLRNGCNMFSYAL